VTRKLITHGEMLLIIITSLLWKENVEMKWDVKVPTVFKLTSRTVIPVVFVRT